MKVGAGEFEGQTCVCGRGRVLGYLFLCCLDLIVRLCDALHHPLRNARSPIPCLLDPRAEHTDINHAITT